MFKQKLTSLVLVICGFYLGQTINIFQPRCQCSPIVNADTDITGSPPLLRDSFEIDEAIRMIRNRFEGSGSDNDYVSPVKLPRLVFNPKLLGVPDDNPENVMDWLLEFVDASEGQVIDVGAHRGEESLVTAARGFRVVAFEADPKNCNAFEHNVRVAETAKDIVIHCVAVGDYNGVVSFGTDDDSSSGSKIGGVEKSVGLYNVTITTLDTTLANADILVLKSDTQGNEMNVLKGAKELIEQKRVKYIIVEVSDGMLRRAGSSTVEVLQYLLNRRYMCTHLALFGRAKAKNKQGWDFKRFKRGDLVANKEKVMTFEQFVHLTMDPTAGTAFSTGLPGWTDILCFQM